MNTRHIANNIIVGLLLGGAVGAASAEAPYPPDAPLASTTSRAQVIAELQRARANGEILVTDQNPADRPLVSTLTRAQVIAQLRQARADGDILVSDHYPADKPFHSTLTRREVTEQLQQARTGGAAGTARENAL